MTLQYTDQKSSDTSLAPDIQISGMTVTVAAMDFLWRGDDLSLEDSEEFTVQAGVGLIAYLVLDNSDGSVRVLVDQIGSEDVPFHFEPGGPYTLIAYLLRGDVPDGTTDLGDVPLRAVRVVLDTQEERQMRIAALLQKSIPTPVEEPAPEPEPEPEVPIPPPWLPGGGE